MSSCKTLFELATFASAKLVHKSLKRTQKQTPPEELYAVSSEKYLATALIVQNHLRLHLAPVSKIWETLFHAAVDYGPSRGSLTVLDERLLYVTFIHPDVNVHRFKMPELRLHYVDHRGDVEYGEDVDDATLSLYENRVEFWTKYIPLLSKLVELDVMDVESKAVIFTLIKASPNLEVISLPRSLEVFQMVLKSLPDIREILHARDFIFNFRVDEIEYALNELRNLEVLDLRINANYFHDMKLQHPLQLTKLRLRCFDPNELLPVLNLCPNLQELDLAYDSITSEYGLFQTLSSSKCTFTKLNLYDIDIHRYGEHLFANKGVHITHISFFLLYEEDVSLHIVSKNCINLTSLYLNQIEHESSFFNKAIFFPKLEQLSFGNVCKSTFALADYCLVNAPNVKSFGLKLYPDACSTCKTLSNMDDSFEQFFCTNQQVKKLTTLKLSVHLEEYTLQMVQSLYENCTQLSHLEIGPLTDQARRYLKNMLKMKSFYFKIVGSNKVLMDDW